MRQLGQTSVFSTFQTGGCHEEPHKNKATLQQLLWQLVHKLFHWSLLQHTRGGLHLWDRAVPPRKSAWLLWSLKHKDTQLPFKHQEPEGRSAVVRPRKACCKLWKTLELIKTGAVFTVELSPACQCPNGVHSEITMKHFEYLVRLIRDKKKRTHTCPKLSPGRLNWNGKETDLRAVIEKGTKKKCLCTCSVKVGTKCRRFAAHTNTTHYPLHQHLQEYFG